MTERSPLVAVFRRDALAILERRNSPSAKIPIRHGKIVIQPLAKGFRLDVMGKGPNGKPVRLATTHYQRLQDARSTARKLGATMGVQVRDMTLERKR